MANKEMNEQLFEYRWRMLGPQLDQEAGLAYLAKRLEKEAVTDPLVAGMLQYARRNGLGTLDALCELIRMMSDRHQTFYRNWERVFYGGSRTVPGWFQDGAGI